MKRTFVLYPLLILLAFVAGCTSSTEVYLSPYTGSPGEVIVVMSDQNWDNAPGTMVRAGLLQDAFGIDKHEPSFDLMQAEEENFGQLLRVHRNIIIVRIVDSDANEVPRIEFKKSVWSKEQLVIEINARNYEAFEEVWSQNLPSIVAQLNKEDKARLMDKYDKQRNVHIKAKLEEKYKLSLNVPTDFDIVRESEDFIWIRREAQRFVRENGVGADHDITQNVFIYSYPYTDTAQFTTEAQLAMRDSIGKNFVPGNIVGSYIQTEKVHFKPVFVETEKFGQYALEIRGLWKLEGAPGAFMGGPFIGLTCYDERLGRLIYIEGNVFAPKFPKREYVRELEAMIYSISTVE